MEILDTPILNKFQQISDWSQDWFGITNFSIVKFCAPTCLILLSSEFLYYLIIKNDVFYFTLGLLFSIGIISTNQMIKAAAIYCKENPEQQNPLIIELRERRPISLLICILVIMLLVVRWKTTPIADVQDVDKFFDLFFATNFDVGYVIYVIFLHFGSCTPKPYKTSRAKKFAQNLIAKARTSTSLEPA